MAQNSRTQDSLMNKTTMISRKATYLDLRNAQRGRQSSPNRHSFKAKNFRIVASRARGKRRRSWPRRKQKKMMALKQVERHAAVLVVARSA